MSGSETHAVTVNDPINGSIQAACKMLEECFKFANSPAGQELVIQCLKDGKATREAVADAWRGIKGFFE
jgi:hypothetical protein